MRAHNGNDELSKIGAFFVLNRTPAMEGAELYGLDAEINDRLLAKRDPEFEREVLIWIEETANVRLESREDVKQALQDGTALCRLMNALAPGQIKTFNQKGKMKRAPAIMEVENIQIYQGACWKLGVEDCFTVADLHKGKNLGLVVNNVASLCRTAVGLGWKGKALGPIQTGANAVKKWNAVETAPNYRHTDDAPIDKIDQVLTQLNLDLVEATQEKLRLTSIKLNLEAELRGVRETRETDRNKLQTRIDEAEAKRDIAVKQETEIKVLPTNENDEKEKRDAWRNASEKAAGAIRTAADAEREEREAEEKLADQAAARVANMADEKARLQERLEALRMEPVRPMRTPPRRPGPTAEDAPPLKMTPVKNAIGFYYAATKNTDPEKLERLQDSIRDLMLSREVGFSVVSMLASEFEQEAGRRVLGVCLKIILKQKKTIELQNDSFELLLFLINTSLVHMDLKQPADFVTGRVFMSAAHKVFRKSSDGEDHVFNYIREHPMWKSLEFWEENFWASEVRRVRKQGTNIGFKESAVSMVYNAYSWGLAHPEETHALLERILLRSDGGSDSETALAKKDLNALIPNVAKKQSFGKKLGASIMKKKSVIGKIHKESAKSRRESLADPIEIEESDDDDDENRKEMMDML